MQINGLLLLLEIQTKICYNFSMYNWSVDEEAFKKADPEGYEKWRLEQLINFGLNGEKISESKLRKHWNKLMLDPLRKRYLAAILHLDEHSH